MRSSVTQEELIVEPLLLHPSTLRRVSYDLFQMFLGYLPRQVFQACTIGMRPKDQDNLAREHFGILPIGLGKCLG